MVAQDEPALGAAGHYQTSASYFLSWGLTKIFGMSATAIRLTSVLPYMSALTLFYLCGLRLGGGTLFLLLFTTLFASNSALHYISLEASFSALSLLGLGAWLLALIQYHQRPTRDALVFLGSATALFLTTSIHEPFVMVSLALIIHLGLHVVLKEKKWRNGALAILLGLSAWLPFQWYITDRARKSGYASFKLQALTQLPEEFWQKLSLMWVPNYTYSLGAALYLLAVGVYLKFVKEKIQTICIRGSYFV
jgi:hypothetical protein